MRRMVWVEKERFGGWACSECAWVFKPPEWATGKSIAELAENYERERNTEFSSHVCADHPKGASQSKST